MNQMLIKIRSASAGPCVGFNELDGRAGRGILLIGLSRLHGKAALDEVKAWLKIDAIQRKIEEAATASRFAGRQKKLPCKPN